MRRYQEHYLWENDLDAQAENKQKKRSRLGPRI